MRKATTLLVLLLGIIVGVAGLAQASGPRFGLVVMSTASEYWLAVKAGAEDALAEVNGTLIYTGPSTDADIQGQIDRIDDLINAEVDAILVTPLNPDALVAPVQRAIERGIPTIVIDSAINWDGMTSFVATDNVEGGRIAMEELAKLIGYKGKVVIINGLPGIPSNDARNIGAQEVAEKYPEITLLPIQYGEDKMAGMQNMENILTAHPDLAGVFGGYDRGALGAAQALINRGLEGKVKFVAYDANPDEIAYLEQGIIDVLLVQQPYEQGRIAVALALKAMAGEEVPKVVHSPLTIVTRDNMNEPEVQKVLYPLQ
ncbi:sugar ABC transporter substrate-binding protein [Candidatus Darwinibacter acetoxidans]|jgi:ribose transport system substrate-binding protein